MDNNNELVDQISIDSDDTDFLLSRSLCLESRHEIALTSSLTHDSEERTQHYINKLTEMVDSSSVSYSYDPTCFSAIKDKEIECLTEHSSNTSNTNNAPLSKVSCEGELTFSPVEDSYIHVSVEFSLLKRISFPKIHLFTSRLLLYTLLK